MAKCGITTVGCNEHDGTLAAGVSIKLSVAAATIWSTVASSAVLERTWLKH